MKRVTLFCGHYGSGKTNLAVNRALSLARAGKRVLIADLDVVNPYFRTRDSEDALREAGVRIVVSPYANSNVDIPALPQEMYAITDDRAYHAVVDVGGDDRGALALGRYAPALREEDDFAMIFVVNFYRPLTRGALDAYRVLKEIETACGLPVSGIVNNSNLGQQTTAADVLFSTDEARALCEMARLPLIGTSARTDIAESLKNTIDNICPIVLRSRQDWAIW